MSESDFDSIVSRFAENIEVVPPAETKKRGPQPKNRDPKITASVKQSYDTQQTLGVVVPGAMSRLLAAYVANGAKDLGISVRLTYTFLDDTGEEVTTTRNEEVPKDNRDVLLRFQGRDKQRTRQTVSND